MSESEAPLDRRDFLRGSLAVAAGAMGVPVIAEAEAAGGALAPTVEQRARAFLREFVPGWLPLETAASEANWAASTDVSEAHTAAQVARNLELNRYVGAPRVIDTVRRLLEHKDELNDLTVRQLEKVRLRAAEAPGTVPEIVKARAEAEARQSAAQDGFTFRIHRRGS
jgi:peptidyl-dipeptidase A